MLASAPDSPLTHSAFHLDFHVRRSAHETDVYTAEVGSLARLDELPEIVRGKVDEPSGRER